MADSSFLEACFFLFVSPTGGLEEREARTLNTTVNIESWPRARAAIVHINNNYLQTITRSSYISFLFAPSCIYVFFFSVFFFCLLFDLSRRRKSLIVTHFSTFREHSNVFLFLLVCVYIYYTFVLYIIFITRRYTHGSGTRTHIIYTYTCVAPGLF